MDSALEIKVHKSCIISTPEQLQFFKHIVDLGLSKADFELYNTFYCGVSGSPVSPDRGKVSDYIVVKDINGKDMIIVDGVAKEAGDHDFPWENDANNGNK